MVSSKVFTGFWDVCSIAGMSISATKPESMCLFTVQTTKLVFSPTLWSVNETVGEIQILRGLIHKIAN